MPVLGHLFNNIVLLNLAPSALSRLVANAMFTPLLLGGAMGQGLPPFGRRGVLRPEHGRPESGLEAVLVSTDRRFLRHPCQFYRGQRGSDHSTL
jgi:hypothetical protein